MTDKDTIDYCKNCSVEPPAMKFKCPECKHNPNKEQVICKYKFQDKEKFDGKPYCTCFCELCEDLPPCDDNCQIYEDYKRLTCKTSECEELKERKLKLELNENHNKNEIKKLKKRIRKDREFFKNKISSLTLARKQFLEALDHFNWQIGLVKNDTYRKALEEIEEELKEDIYCESQECGCDDSEECLRCTKDLILDIISKAKGEEK